MEEKNTTEKVIQRAFNTLNNMSLSLPIAELNKVTELKDWLNKQQLPTIVNTIRFSSIYMTDLFINFDLSAFTEKTEREYTNEEYVIQVMNCLGYSSVYDMLKKNHPSLNTEYQFPSVWFDSSTTAFIIIGGDVWKYNPTINKIGDKINNFFK